MSFKCNARSMDLKKAASRVAASPTRPSVAIRMAKLIEKVVELDPSESHRRHVVGYFDEQPTVREAIEAYDGVDHYFGDDPDLDALADKIDEDDEITGPTEDGGWRQLLGQDA